jgi:GNAT superfamily N-acetyltransferase
MMVGEIEFISTKTIVHYLKMESNPQFGFEIKDIIIIELLKKPITSTKYLEFYNKVGKNWNWTERVLMNNAELEKIINSDNNEIYVFSKNNTNIGYAEFINHNNFVEIQYFGLFPEHTGKGLGKQLFKWCISKAWSYKPEWVQLNTCDLDHKSAIPMYKELGFAEYETVNVERFIYLK